MTTDVETERLKDVVREVGARLVGELAQMNELLERLATSLEQMRHDARERA